MVDLIAYFKAGNRLHRKYALEILLRVHMLLKELPTLVDVNVPQGSKVLHQIIVLLSCNSLCHW